MNIQITFLIISFIFTAFLGKLIIPILKKLKVGQSERQDGPRSHLRKQGTPTMGGIMIMISIIVFTAIVCLLNKEIETIKPILMISIASLGFGIVGFIDDFKKVILHNTDGLSPKLKMFGLLIVSSIYTLVLMKYTDVSTTLILPFTDITFTLPTWAFIPFSILVMLSTTNAVNLTDGIDGLAASLCVIMITAISIIAIKLGNIPVSLFGSIVIGSCAGFLIYNFHKAKVIMGDTGSLLLGGVISSMAIYLQIPIFLLIIAIIPIAETLSVILQVLYFQKTGKRLFRMSPLHHHFELTGWRENRVVGVFSLVTLLCSIIGIIAI